MTNVMLGGSRHISNLPQVALEKLNDYMATNAWFLVGDASGADSLFQRYLAQRKYSRVVVFTSLDQARNNFGGWECRPIESSLKSQSAAKHTVKDRKMVELANEGLMIWDNKSPGTLANAIDFIDHEKTCYVWTPDDEYFWNLETRSALQSLLERNLEVATESQKRLNTFKNRENSKPVAVEEKGLF